MPTKFDQKFCGIISRYPSNPGKGIRSNILIKSAQTFSAPIKNALYLAAAIEITHNWLLVHDDILDRSSTRRNFLTLFQSHGSDTALNAGDALMSSSIIPLFLSTQNLPKNTQKRIIELFANTILTTLSGQHTELEWRHKKKLTQNYSDYFDMIQRKTSYYTFIFSLQAPAIMSKKYSKLNLLFNIGTHLGRAFQIVDDLDDLRKDDQDLQESKITLILLHTYKNLSKNDQRQLELIYSKTVNHKNQRDINTIIKFIEKTNSEKYTKSIAKKEIKLATNLINKLPEDYLKKYLQDIIYILLQKV